MSVDFAEAIAAATNIRDSSDYISAIKRVVADQLVALDPTARLEDTRYFSHSAIPDFVIHWSKTHKRDVYLRGSFSSIRAQHDAEHLAETSPVILAFSPDVESEASQADAVGQISSSLGASPTALITEPQAIQEITTSASDGAASPLRQLVQGNFLDGARGVVDVGRARTLTHDATDDGGMEAISSVFREDVATKIDAATRLMRMAVSSDLGVEIDSPVLSADQARQVLPWLLTTENVRGDAAFWRHVGTNLSLDFLLKEMATELDGLELTPLITANAGNWTAIRAYLGTGLGDLDEGDAAKIWTLTGRRLVGRLGNARLTFATNGHLQGQIDGVSSATWSQLASQLAGFRLHSISLRGLQRHIRLEAEESHDIRGDVQRINSSLEDNYFVDTLSVINPEDDSENPILIDLGRMLALTDTGVSVGQLTRILTTILAYKNPYGAEVVNAFLGRQSL